jgi:hypothetical protein
MKLSFRKNGKMQLCIKLESVHLKHDYVRIFSNQFVYRIPWDQIDFVKHNEKVYTLKNILSNGEMYLYGSKYGNDYDHSLLYYSKLENWNLENNCIFDGDFCYTISKTVFKIFKNFGQDQSDYEILVHRNYGLMEIRNFKTGITVKVYGERIE